MEKEILDKSGKPIKRTLPKKVFSKKDKSQEKNGIKKVPEIKHAEQVNFNEHLLQDGGSYQLIIPRSMPGRGRIIAMVFGKREIKTESGLLIPATSVQENQRHGKNPCANYEYRTVAYHQEINKEFRLKTNNIEPDPSDGTAKYKPRDTKLEIGDYLKVGYEFVPVIIREGKNEYAVLHYMDIIAVEKSPVMLTEPSKALEK